MGQMPKALALVRKFFFVMGTLTLPTSSSPALNRSRRWDAGLSHPRAQEPTIPMLMTSNSSHRFGILQNSAFRRRFCWKLLPLPECLSGRKIWLRKTQPAAPAPSTAVQRSCTLPCRGPRPSCCPPWSSPLQLGPLRLHWQSFSGSCWLGVTLAEPSRVGESKQWCPSMETTLRFATTGGCTVVPPPTSASSRMRSRTKISRFFAGRSNSPMTWPGVFEKTFSDDRRHSGCRRHAFCCTASHTASLCSNLSPFHLYRMAVLLPITWC